MHGFTDDHLVQPGRHGLSINRRILCWCIWRNETQAHRGPLQHFVVPVSRSQHLTERVPHVGHASGPFYKAGPLREPPARRLVLESGNDLGLASGAPLAHARQVDSINTWFGPVGYTLRPGSEERTIVARVHPPARNAPDNLWLYVRVPEGRKITGVWIGGRQWTGFDPAAERVRLPKSTEPVDVVVVYE